MNDLSYIQHQYTVNQPWSLNSETSVLEGDEELLVLDQSRLGFDDDFVEEDYCRCNQCETKNISSIAMISNGGMGSHTNDELEPSDNHSHHHNHDHSHDHSHGHSHEHNNEHNWTSVHCHPTSLDNRQTRAVKKANRQLIIGCLLCLAFMIAEVIGGYISNSLAIMTDAAHLLSDLASFLLSLFAIWISQRKPTKKMSFGYYRAEVLGAVASIFMIWVLTGILVYMAIDRVKNSEYEINSTAMLIVSGSGVAMNIIMGVVLSGGFCGKKADDEESGGHGHSHGGFHGHSHGGGGGGGHSHANMNVRAALIHVMGDLIQSVGVLIAAFIIRYKPEYKIADPICTFLFSGLVLFTTFNIMKDAVHVLMEGFPLNLDYTLIKESLQQIEGVRTIHSLHIWSLTLNKNALSVHLAIDFGTDPDRILKVAESLIRKDYDIQQTTIQVERFERTMNSCKTCKGP